MAQLFIQDGSREWSVLPLTEDLYRISLSGSKTGLDQKAARAVESLPVPVVEPTRIESIAREGALLLRRDGSRETSNDTEPPASSAGWAVLTGPGTRIRVNGVAIAVGIATLRHRDEIGFECGAPLYFSTERLASVETYTASDSPRCPRCTLPIEAGDLYVRCPGCNVLHHQLPDRECFSYSPSCALCDQSSSLAADFRWSPGGL
jgi:hypothetical protein